jgi:hypothetical protein
MPNQEPAREISPEAASLLAEARQAYGTPAERADRADRASDQLHNTKASASEAAQARF